MKKKIRVILIVTFIICTLFSYKTINADSGWDTDYDSDSSWDSNSDWNSESGWESSSDWNSESNWDNDNDNDWDAGSSGSSSHSKADPETIKFIILIFASHICFVIVIFLIFRIVKTIRNRINDRKYEKTWKKIKSNISIDNSVNKYVDIDISKIKEIDSNIDVKKFKNEAFNIYKELQTAWMNFDTETIRKLTTDEIYNMYSSQLETLKLKKQKNIMKDIELIDVKIIDIYKENDVITIDTYLNVRCYDYVIKEATGEVVRGKDNAKINIKYKLSFVKSASNNKKEEKCPNCGAPVDIVSSATCPYCDSTLVKDAGDYVMSKKVSLGQTLER